VAETPEGCTCGECTEQRGYYFGKGCWEERVGPVARGDRGLAPDGRDINDLSTAEVCNSCTWSPAVVLLTPEGWECYNCGSDPNA
jgi:hypothetical protein